LLWFACLVLLLVVSGTLCNLSLHAWTLAFHRRTLSVYGKACLTCLLGKGCTLWILLWETFCSPLFRSFGILSFCDHSLDSCCPYILWLLGCGSHSCHTCGIFFFDFHICFFYHPLAIMSVCYCIRLLHLQTCSLCP
jgi:hypothetical protein